MTQIYSIQTVDEALECIEAGADNIGVAISTGAKLPAEVSAQTCAEIFAAIGRRAKTVLIVVSQSAEPVLSAARSLKPDILHLCGNEFFATPELVRELKSAVPGMEVMQAVAVDGPEALERAAYFGAFCDYLILDSADPHIAGIGAAGITHDWAIDTEIVRRVPCRVIIAGGLDAENVGKVIRRARPFGVDSFTKTSEVFPDGRSRKNMDKVRAFIQAARAAFAEIGR